MARGLRGLFSGKQLAAIMIRLRERGLLAKRAGEAVKGGIVRGFEGVQRFRKGTFLGSMGEMVGEEFEKSAEITKEQELLAKNTGKMLEALKKTIRTGGEKANVAIRAIAKWGQRRTGQSFITAPVALATTLAEGTVGAGKVLGQEVLERYTKSPTVKLAEQTYGAAVAVGSPMVQGLGRAARAFRKGGQMVGGTARVPYDPNIPGSGTFTGPVTPRQFQKSMIKAGINRLFKITPPRSMPGATLNTSKAIVESSAGPAGGFRKFAFEMGMGEKKPIEVIDATLKAKLAELRGIHAPLKAIQSERAALRAQWKAGTLSDFEYDRRIKELVEPAQHAVRLARSQKENLTAEVYKLLRDKRTGGYDVDVGHYAVGAATVGTLAGLGAKLQYERFEGARGQRAQEKIDSIITRELQERLLRHDPKMSVYEAKALADNELARRKQERALQILRGQATAGYEAFQQYPDVGVPQARPQIRSQARPRRMLPRRRVLRRQR